MWIYVYFDADGHRVGWQEDFGDATVYTYLHVRVSLDRVAAETKQGRSEIVDMHRNMRPKLLR